MYLYLLNWDKCIISSNFYCIYMANISNTINFHDICYMLEKLKSYNKFDKKKSLLERYYASFQKYRAEFRKENNLSTIKENGESSFYCVLRCLMPQNDKARNAYGLQITTLGHVYIKVLKLAPDSREAQLLKVPRYNGRNIDYADIISSILEKRCTKKNSQLSLQRIHEMLDIIANENRENTEMILTELSEIASAQEQKWFIRLLLKTMNLGIGEQKIFDILHIQCKELYKRCSNLSRVCCLLADNALIEDITENNEKLTCLDLNSVIEPFEHVQSMLCEIFPGNIETLMADDVLYLETKQDGERFQLHFSDGKFKYFSRNSKDYTSSFGCDYETGSLTPLLQSLLPIGMISIILDGEMMVWDTQTLSYRDKGENTDVKHLSNRENWRPCFIVYDLLYLNGRSWLDVPYVRRILKLREILHEQIGVLQIIKNVKITSVEDFREKYQYALDNNEEGVVIKKKKSLYKPGVRQGGGWYKVKADYIQGLTTDFDLLIMGGFYNRSRTFIESFLLGVLKYTSCDEFEIYSVAKVLNINRRRRILSDMLKIHWKNLSNETPPSWYHYCASSSDGRPDVWIHPHNSTILQTKAADLAPSSNFALMKSLHFARIQSWRNDKVWHECMSLLEYMQMCQSKTGLKKINKRELQLEDITTDRKQQKITTAQQRKLRILAYEQKIDIKNIQVKSALFDGFRFCILSGDMEGCGKRIEDIKKIIIENSGELVENPIPNDAKCITIAGDITYRVQTVMRADQIDILSIKWLLKCCNKQHIQIFPHDLLHTTKIMKEQFEERCDEYGDSYTDEICEEDLKMILQKMNNKKLLEQVPDKDINLIKEKLFLNDYKYFKGYYGVFYEIKEEYPKLLFTHRGGIILNIQEKDINEKLYIFIDEINYKEFDFKFWLNENFNENVREKSNLHVVSYKWIIQSNIENNLQNIQKYLLKL